MFGIKIIGKPHISEKGKAKIAAKAAARQADRDAKQAEIQANDPGIILIAEGLKGTSIKLFADHVKLTRSQNGTPTTLLIKDIVALNYQKHLTPLWMRFTYIENGKNREIAILGSPFARLQFDAMEKRIKQMMAGGGMAMQPQQPQVSAYDELAKLAALRDQGVVTEQEFQEQKAKLLGTQSANQSEKRFDPQTGRPL